MEQAEKHVLSKSSFMRGLQCEKALYLYKHHYALRDKPPPEREAMFERGNRIGLLARELFPGGVDATPSSIKQFAKAAEQTKLWIKAGKTIIYEAAFKYEQVLVAIDILVFENEKWKGYEVKSSSRITKAHIIDASVQYHVITGAGIPLEDISIIHVNNNYQLEGELELNKLFAKKSVKKKVLENQPDIAQKIQRLKGVIDQPQVPPKEIGMHCFRPYPCDFMGYCWKDVPEHSVFNLIGIHKETAFELYDSGVKQIIEVPEENELNQAQDIQRKARKTGETVINQPAIKQFLKQLKFPLLFADFESMQPPVPLFQSSKPYEQIPFQFSIHKLENEKAELQHIEFLADHLADPRETFLVEFLKHTEGEGSIVVYNQQFEKMILKYLKRFYPEHTKAVDNRLSRVVDLMQPFKDKHYYSTNMQGSYSIKKVLPAMAPHLSYNDLVIKNGHTASAAFEALRTPTDLFQVDETREALLRYCELDTLAMVEIYSVLNQLAN